MLAVTSDKLHAFCYKMSATNIISQIKESQKTFVIAEIGQNHQGDLSTAKKLISVAKVRI